MRVQILQCKRKEKQSDPKAPIKAKMKDSYGKEYVAEFVNEELAKASNVIDNFFAEEVAKDSKRLVISFDKEEVSKSLIARRIGESIAVYLDMQYKTTTAVKETEDSFEINFEIYARSVIDSQAFSNEDLDKLKEYINRTVMKYGISPVTDIEEGYVEC